VPELVLRLVQLGFLALLWLFVLAAVRAVRTDLFGPGTRSGVARPAVPAPTPKADRAARKDRKDRATRKPAKGQPSRLVVTEGSLRGTTVELTGAPVTIGRAEGATLVIADDYASNRHARLIPDGSGGWVVEDLGSTNGTFLDRTKVSEPTPVPIGVPIRIGRTVLELRR
jgi:pSer/pThr/pTyr-binding forkhead associated (FHA) protein